MTKTLTIKKAAIILQYFEDIFVSINYLLLSEAQKCRMTKNK